MAKKLKTVEFVCSNCGSTFSTWSGRCYKCDGWNTLVEQVSIDENVSSGSSLALETVNTSLAKDMARLKSKISDIDNVLGGGLVPGSVILLVGQPGIGKSTILTQIANSLSASYNILYVSGEESPHQIGIRANRLGVDSKKLKIATSNSTNDILSTINNDKFDVVIVDSIQTITINEVSSSAGSTTQVIASAQLLSEVAKRKNTTIILVGHVTKEGNIAGPKLLEHMVDVVLELEGDRYGGFKLIRSVKNRFGSTNEVGIFEMSDKGFIPVENPSASLLAERQVSDGSIVLSTMEGSRPLLVEVQSLVNRATGYPKRAASGVDINRVNLLVAMLEKRTKLNLSGKDIYINIVGGIRITEPAADLAICMAIASAAKGMKLKMDAVVFGEVGLSGEIRRVPYINSRVDEAKRLGFKAIVGPRYEGMGIAYKGMTNLRATLNKFLLKE